jgi:hypothetical protein
MKSHFMKLTLRVAALTFLVVGVCQAQQAPGAKAIPKAPDGKPDLRGIWRMVNSQVSPMQLTQMGLEKFNYNKLPKGDGGRPEYDPIMHCYRPGLARLGPPLLVPSKSVVVRLGGQNVPAPDGTAAFDAIQIAYAPGRVWVIFAYNQETRQIFTDGRPHPEFDPDDLERTMFWNGHSVGTWDGDAFVVDTTNLRNETWLDNMGHENRQLHIVERLRRLDSDTLQIDRTSTDPVMLARPYKTTATLKLTPNMAFQENVVCGQYYYRQYAFGYDGLLGTWSHPYGGPDRSSSTPTFSELPK